MSERCKLIVPTPSVPLQAMTALLLILPGNTASSVCQPDELAHFGQRYHAVALDFPCTVRSDRSVV